MHAAADQQCVLLLPASQLTNYWPQVQARGGGGATGGWALLSAFSPAVWLALLGTALAVGALAWLAEVATQNLRGEAGSLLALVWDSLGRFTQLRDAVAYSNAAALLILAYSFLCFLLL